MNVRNGDTVSAVAVVVEDDAELGADVAENGDAPHGEQPNGDSPAAEARQSVDDGSVDDGSADGSPNGSS
jgi:hypothetical protein